jgi:ABC-2 type transport system permease protein
MSDRIPDGVGLFLWVRARTARSSLHALVRTPVKLGIMIVLWSVLLGGLYALAHRGIRFINETAGVGPFLLSRLWFLFLFVILLLLAVSQMVNAYSTLVRAPEIRWWMTLPVSARTLLRAKWLESSFYSSWAAAVTVLPIWLAYLSVLQRPVLLLGWWILAWLVPLTGIVSAAATGALLLWLRWVGRVAIRREFLVLGFVSASIAFFWLLGERQPPGEPHDAWFLALQALLPRMRIAMSPWLPSGWMATAMDALLGGRWIECGLYTLLLWTTAALAWRGLDHLGARLLLPVLRRFAHAPELSADRGRAVTSPVRLSLPWWSRRPLTAALAKDVFLVSRDPMQWSQAIVFFGLLGAYFANLHRFADVSGEAAWRVGIASLDLACTLLVFGSLAVRFVFPQMSLEGRSLWIVRVAPQGMRRLLLSKLLLYSVLGIAVIDGLLALSVSRLGVPTAIGWWLAAVGVVAAVALVGLTVGFGAWWADPAAQDAARVVSSSNGAIVLVLMLGYVAGVVAALVIAWAGWGAGAPWRFAAATLGLLAVSAAAAGIPLRKGLVRLERLEDAA